MGAFHLSYKAVKRLKVIGYAWNVYLMQMPGQQAENAYVVVCTPVFLELIGLTDGRKNCQP